MDSSLMYGFPTKYHLDHPEILIFVKRNWMYHQPTIWWEYWWQKNFCSTQWKQQWNTWLINWHPFYCPSFYFWHRWSSNVRYHLEIIEKISDVPISWKLGIDIMSDLQGRNDFDLFVNNYGPESMMEGGPRCTYNGIEKPCFVCKPPKASITWIISKNVRGFG